MKKSEKDKYEEKIRKLEERVMKLEEEKNKKKEERLEEGGETSAAEILGNVGRIFGLNGLIKGVEKLPEFQERLKKIDEELRRKLKTTPLKRTEEKILYGERRFRARPSRSKKPGIRKEIHLPREREADIFDEKEFISVILEFPGADEKSIKINLEKDKLAISADKNKKKYHKEIVLPCVPKGEITKGYKNGILEIKIKK